MVCSYRHRCPGFIYTRCRGLVAQSVERPLKGPSKEVLLSGVGLNPGQGIRWQEKILPAPPEGEHGNKFALWQKVEEKNPLKIPQLAR